MLLPSYSCAAAAYSKSSAFGTGTPSQPSSPQWSHLSVHLKSNALPCIGAYLAFRSIVQAVAVYIYTDYKLLEKKHYISILPF